MRPINVFIGYDKCESVAWHTLVQSIMDNTSYPNIRITQLNTDVLRKAGIYTRPKDEKKSTEFSYTRFLVPYLMGYEGHAIFMDCDMLFRGDIHDLMLCAEDDTKAVHVIKHFYIPKNDIKFKGNRQIKYDKKNWSSVMIYNCAHWDTVTLTPTYVNKASGMELHQFKWCDEWNIGELHMTWNWLVGEYPHNPYARNVHFTIGGPWFEQYENCDYSFEWLQALRRMVNVDDDETLDGSGKPNGIGSLPDLSEEDCYGEGEEDPPDENASQFKVGRKAK